jgi:hypothetical protein
MTAAAPGDRHLTTEGLDHYLAAGAPAMIKIEGEPVAYLVIEPAAQRLALRTPLARQALPDLHAYQHISTTALYWGDSPWSELRIEGGSARDAYPVLCAIADRIQLDGVDFGPAVQEALDSFRELLSTRQRLSFEEEIGLFGELILLKNLLAHLSSVDAVASWRGPDKEEHDFDVAGHDIEVKSTVSEERLHWINDLNQLEPALARPLWLVSVQLTGAADGHALAELISDIRALLSAEPDREAFGRKLAQVGWRDDMAPMHPRKWRLRSEPALYAVNGDFPALTAKRLGNAGVDLTRLVQIRYFLNLAGLRTSTDFPVFLQNLYI